jgi:UDP-2-acetamido-3-amino-2,3-dideoxy-glucuronate N-acetyltransferase
MNFIHPTARIGADSQVWNFAVVLAGVVIGDHCSIGSGAEIGRGTTIGDGSRIGAHVFLPPNSRVGNNVFIGPGVICTDDKYPRVNNPDYFAQPPVIEDGAAIGAGAILLPGVRIGKGALIGAGAIVTSSVIADGCVRCQPARIARLPRPLGGEGRGEGETPATKLPPHVDFGLFG